MEPLGGLDAAFLSLEGRNTHLHVGAVLVMDPPEGKGSLFSPSTRFAQVRRMVAQRVHLVPPLRRRALRVPLGLAHPVWADDPDFDLDDHLARAAAPAPGGLAELEALVADFMARPLDPDRPLWEMLVVEGLAGGQSALVAKIHHAVLDGVSGASVLAAFLDLGPRARPVPFPAEPWDPPPLPATSSLLRHAASSLARQPEVAAGALQRGLDAMVQVAEHNRQLAEQGRVPPPAPFSAPRTSLNGAVSARRRFAALSVPVEDLRTVRRVLGGTLNDVLLTAVGGAVAGLLAERGEHPPVPLVAMVPVSTRRRSAAPGPVPAGAAAPDHPAPPHVPDPPLGNQVSGMLVTLATDLGDPVARLAAVSRGAQVAKAQERLVPGGLLEGVAQMAAPALAGRAVRWAGGLRLFDRLPPLCNLVVSNVPGPGAALWCAGSRVADLYPVGPVANGVGLNVTTFTYLERVHVGILGCRRLVPDVARLAQLVDAAVAELVGCALRARGAAG